VRWLAFLVVLGLGLAWLGSRSLDVGFGVLDQAVAHHQREAARVGGLTAVAAGPERPASSPAVPTPGRPASPPAAPVAAAPAPVIDDRLRGLGRHEVEARLGSPDGRVRLADGEEWWYGRRIVIFRGPCVVAVR
jgi:hypothetical protein